MQPQFSRQEGSSTKCQKNIMALHLIWKSFSLPYFEVVEKYLAYIFESIISYQGINVASISLSFVQKRPEVEKSS